MSYLHRARALPKRSNNPPGTASKNSHQTINQNIAQPSSTMIPVIPGGQISDMIPAWIAAGVASNFPQQQHPIYGNTIMSGNLPPAAQVLGMMQHQDGMANVQYRGVDNMHYYQSMMGNASQQGTGMLMNMQGHGSNMAQRIQPSNMQGGASMTQSQCKQYLQPPMVPTRPNQTRMANDPALRGKQGSRCSPFNAAEYANAKGHAQYNPQTQRVIHGEKRPQVGGDEQNHREAPQSANPSPAQSMPSLDNCHTKLDLDKGIGSMTTGNDHYSSAGMVGCDSPSGSEILAGAGISPETNYMPNFSDLDAEECFQSGHMGSELERHSDGGKDGMGDDGNPCGDEVLDPSPGPVASAGSNLNLSKSSTSSFSGKSLSASTTTGGVYDLVAKDFPDCDPNLVKAIAEAISKANNRLAGRGISPPVVVKSMNAMGTMECGMMMSRGGTVMQASSGDMGVQYYPDHNVIGGYTPLTPQSPPVFNIPPGISDDNLQSDMRGFYPVSRVSQQDDSPRHSDAATAKASAAYTSTKGIDVGIGLSTFGKGGKASVKGNDNPQKVGLSTSPEIASIDPHKFSNNVTPASVTAPVAAAPVINMANIIKNISAANSNPNNSIPKIPSNIAVKDKCLKNQGPLTHQKFKNRLTAAIKQFTGAAYVDGDVINQLVVETPAIALVFQGGPNFERWSLPSQDYEIRVSKSKVFQDFVKAYQCKSRDVEALMALRPNVNGKATVLIGYMKREENIAQDELTRLLDLLFQSLRNSAWVAGSSAVNALNKFGAAALISNRRWAACLALVLTKKIKDMKPEERFNEFEKFGAAHKSSAVFSAMHAAVCSNMKTHNTLANLSCEIADVSTRCKEARENLVSVYARESEINVEVADSLILDNYDTCVSKLLESAVNQHADDIMLDRAIEDYIVNLKKESDCPVTVVDDELYRALDWETAFPRTLEEKEKAMGEKVIKRSDVAYCLNWVCTEEEAGTLLLKRYLGGKSMQEFLTGDGDDVAATLTKICEDMRCFCKSGSGDMCEEEDDLLADDGMQGGEDAAANAKENETPQDASAKSRKEVSHTEPDLDLNILPRFEKALNVWIDAAKKGLPLYYILKTKSADEAVFWIPQSVFTSEASRTYSDFEKDIRAGHDVQKWNKTIAALVTECWGGMEMQHLAQAGRLLQAGTICDIFEYHVYVGDLITNQTNERQSKREEMVQASIPAGDGNSAPTLEINDCLKGNPPAQDAVVGRVRNLSASTQQGLQSEQMPKEAAERMSLEEWKQGLITEAIVLKKLRALLPCLTDEPDIDIPDTAEYRKLVEVLEIECDKLIANQEASAAFQSAPLVSMPALIDGVVEEQGDAQMKRKSEADDDGEGLKKKRRSSSSNSTGQGNANAEAGGGIFG